MYLILHFNAAFIQCKFISRRQEENRNRFHISRLARTINWKFTATATSFLLTCDNKQSCGSACMRCVTEWGNWSRAIENSLNLIYANCVLTLLQCVDFEMCPVQIFCSQGLIKTRVVCLERKATNKKRQQKSLTRSLFICRQSSFSD